MRRRMTFVLALALTGCSSKATPEDDVRATLAHYGKASAARDYQAICDELLAPALKQNAEQYGLPCELAVKPSLDAAKSPKLAVRSVAVKGDRATAVVVATAANQPPSTDTLTLRLVSGEWRIAAQGPVVGPAG